MSCKPRTLSPEQDDFLKANTDLSPNGLWKSLGETQRPRILGSQPLGMGDHLQDPQHNR